MLSVGRHLSPYLHRFRRLHTQSAARGSCCSLPLFTALLIMLFDLPSKIMRKGRPSSHP